MMLDNKKDQIIKELKQNLKDGEKIFFDDVDVDNNPFSSFSILGTEYKTYIKLEEGLLCKYINDNLERKLEISEVAAILDNIAERKVKELEELDAVTSFLNS